MDKNYIEIISLISAILGIISLSSTLFTYVLNYIKQKKTLEEMDGKLFKQALASSDIKQLGNYLDKNIGNVTIKEFSTNLKIQKKVNHHIQSIISFIGTEEDIKNTNIVLRKPDFVYNYEAPEDFFPILKELRYGRPWNALAQLRRHIEISLRDVVKEYNINVKDFMSITQTLSILDSINLIPASTIHDLKYVISICNKAVHGLDISLTEAEEAIQIAIRALGEINKNNKT